jgi:hypothetical protein
MKNSQALAALLPGVAWTLKNDDLSTLQVPNGVTPPSPTQVANYIASKLYKEQRASLYPSIKDLADALVHQDMGDNGTAVKAYYAACEAVKAKYPKPS